MATEMINLKLDGKFLKEIDALVKQDNYHNRTEFIRDALRDKVTKARMEKAMAEIAHLRGAAKKKTTKAEYERARQKAFDDLEDVPGDIFRRVGL